MKLARVAAAAHRVPLTRPYTIAGATFSEVELFTVRLESDRGLVGLGAASPEEGVTGESVAACAAALAPGRTSELVGRPVDPFGALVARVERLWSDTPAAAAALDMALHDLRARALGLPLADLLGRVHTELPTSITIGILPLDATLAEAREHVGRGFRALKLKIGDDLAEDLARIARVREAVGPQVAIRVDGNQGFAPHEVPRLLAAAREAGVELVEQPTPAAADSELARVVPASELLVADESVHDAADALARARRGRPYAGFVVKLMKCGGVAPALRLARVAEAGGLDLMWGCMDESVVSIAAALHAAFATPATRWLDLDGSFELLRDPARGGFALADGMLRTLPAPGLGVELEP